VAEDFMDCDHLSARGAEHFSALLDEVLGPVQLSEHYRRRVP
jgi:hypothetical protein